MKAAIFCCLLALASVVAAEQAEQTETVLILSPVKDAAAHLDTYFANLRALSYPHKLISIGLLESDAADGGATTARISEELPRLKAEFRRVVYIKKDFGFELDANQKREQDVQMARRSVLAKSRNALLADALSAEDSWVFWLDVDVDVVPANIIETLLAQGKDVVSPHCTTADGADTFDHSTWRETRNKDWFLKAEAELILEGYGEDHGRETMDVLRASGEKLVEVDSVGTSALLVKADIHRRGLVFPAKPYKKHIETEGFALRARDWGYKLYAMPQFEVRHAPVGAASEVPAANRRSIQVVGLPINTEDMTVNVLALGDGFTCALACDGVIYCWGSNHQGIVTGTATLESFDPSKAVAVTLPTSFGLPLAVVAGTDFACAMSAGQSDNVACWGVAVGEYITTTTDALNVVTQTVNVVGGNAANRVKLPGGRSATATGLVAGTDHICAIVDGAAYCLGQTAANFGQLGTTASDFGWYTVTLPELVIDIGAGSMHSCALTRNFEVYCWGNNDYKQLGVLASNAGPNLVDFSQSSSTYLQSGPRQLYLGGTHSCALFNINDDSVTVQGQLVCWGNGALGQIGAGGTDLNLGDASTLEPVLAGVAAATVSVDSTCAISTVTAEHPASTLRCWGTNYDNLLGNNFGSSSTSGVAASLVPDVALGAFNVHSVAVSNGGLRRHACAVVGAGLLQCWGSNKDFQIGTGLTPLATTPPLALTLINIQARTKNVLRVGYCGKEVTSYPKGTGNPVAHTTFQSATLSDGLVVSSTVPLSDTEPKIFTNSKKLKENKEEVLQGSVHVTAPGQALSNLFTLFPCTDATCPVGLEFRVLIEQASAHTVPTSSSHTWLVSVDTAVNADAPAVNGAPIRLTSAIGYTYKIINSERAQLDTGFTGSDLVIRYLDTTDGLWHRVEDSCDTAGRAFQLQSQLSVAFTSCLVNVRFVAVSEPKVIIVPLETFQTAHGSNPPRGWSSAGFVEQTDSEGPQVITEMWDFDNHGSLTLTWPIVAPAAAFDAFLVSSDGTPEQAALVTPSFTTAGITGLCSTQCVYVEFDQWFAPGEGAYGQVEAWNAADDVWEAALKQETFSANPDHQIVDLTPYVSKTFGPDSTTIGFPVTAVRFLWSGQGAFFWIVDNVEIYHRPCAAKRTLCTA